MGDPAEEGTTNESDQYVIDIFLEAFEGEEMLITGEDGVIFDNVTSDNTDLGEE
jgi:hypothetical protein